MLTEGSTINRLDVGENASIKSDSADLAEREKPSDYGKYCQNYVEFLEGL